MATDAAWFSILLLNAFVNRVNRHSDAEIGPFHRLSDRRWLLAIDADCGAVPAVHLVKNCNTHARRAKADQVDRLRLVLSALHQASKVPDMNQPTFRLHPLKGNRKGFWAVSVRAKWRIAFRFEDGEAFDVDLEDYH